MIWRQWIVGLFLALGLSGCDDSDAHRHSNPESAARRSATHAVSKRSGNMLRGRMEGNPAEYPGVFVHRPAFDARFKFNPETDGVIDTSTGNKYSSESPHANGYGLFRLVDPSNEEIVRGRYYVHAADMSDGRRALIIDIISTYVSPPGRKSSIPIDYDANILGKFIRARNERGKNFDSRNFIVVDSRHLRSSKFNK